MDISEEESATRTAEGNLYFRLMQEGLGAPYFRTPKEFSEELGAIAMYTKSPALKKKCMEDMHRFDGVAVPLAANGR